MSAEDPKVVCEENLVKVRQSLKPTKQFVDDYQNGANPHIFVIIGATSSSACKNIYPSLWHSFRANRLPKTIAIFGYAMSPMSNNQFKDKCLKHMLVEAEDESQYEEFWNLHQYVFGSYDQKLDFEVLSHSMARLDRNSISNRVFYLAIPLMVFLPVTRNIKNNCLSQKGWNRLIVEKPFGTDINSLDLMQSSLAEDYTEDQIYRIDHYLNREMVENLLAIRFANRIFTGLWNRENIASVLITFKEPLSVLKVEKFYDEIGIIRDVMVNHLLQILSLIAMEKPSSYEPNDIRHEKVKILRAIPPVELGDCVLGQYISDPAIVTDGADKRIESMPRAPSYAMAVLHIDNERWNGVPFILSCGKALNERSTEVRIQYQDVHGGIFAANAKRNELVIRLQPNDQLSTKIMTRATGVEFDLAQHSFEMNINDKDHSQVDVIPEAYEHLIADVLGGSAINFYSFDELKEAWRIFTPILQQIDDDEIVPVNYIRGSAGPVAADIKCEENNFKLYESFTEVFGNSSDDSF